jgi:plasmid stabilization system protein ParE
MKSGSSIAAGNPEAADRVMEEILRTIRSQITFPHLGHVRSDLTSRPVRFHPVREFLVAYAPEEHPLLVLAVLHGRRNPRVIAVLLRNRG